MSRDPRLQSHTLLIVSLLLLGALTVLGVFVLIKVDPEEVRKELIGRLVEMKRRGGLDPEKLDPMAEELLANELYRKYGGTEFRMLEKIHSAVHPQAQKEREARAAAAPVLAQLKEVGSLSEAQLSRLHDEILALRNRYSGTKTAEVLDAHLAELEDRSVEQIRATIGTLTARRSSVPLALVRLQRDVQMDLREHRYSTARRKTDEFGRGLESDTDAQTKLRELIGAIERAASAHAQSILAQAREHVALGRKPEALRLLDEALPELAGFAQVGPLQALARELR